MYDPRWDDPRERDDGRARVYDERDRADHDPRDGLMRDLDLPRGEHQQDKTRRVVRRRARQTATNRWFHAPREGSRASRVAGSESGREATDCRGRAQAEGDSRKARPFGRGIPLRADDRHRDIRPNRDKLREELTLVQMDRYAGELEELDVEGILAFAERVLPSASNLWVQSSLNQKQRLQQLFFPEGVRLDGKRLVGTGLTLPVFSYLAPAEDSKVSLVDLTGIEPVTS